MEETVARDSANASTSSNSATRQTRAVLSQCKICGVPARYSYYGAIVCHSCKMFFKRNAGNRQTLLKCDFDNTCEINIHNRRACSSYRLAKCFATGMRPELIRRPPLKQNKISRKKKSRTDSTSSATTSLMKTTDQHQSSQILTSNLLHSDQSILSIDQWNLLSNIVQCFDEHSGYLFVERFIEEQNSLPLKLRFKLSSVSDFFTSMMGKVQLVFEKNRDCLSLSLHDRTTLLRTTVEYTTSVGGIFTLRQHKLFDYASFYSSVEIIFSPVTATITKRAIDQLDSDETFIKLILAIFSFSTTNYTVCTRSNLVNLTNIKAMLLIQNRYTELAWRYLLYMYGHHEAVIRFSNIIRYLLFVNDATVEAYESQQYIEIIHSIVEQTERTLSVVK